MKKPSLIFKSRTFCEVACANLECENNARHLSDGGKLEAEVERWAIQVETNRMATLAMGNLKTAECGYRE